MKDVNKLYNKALAGEFLSVREGKELYTRTPSSQLFYLADQIRFKKNPLRRVSWQIDLNVNYTNVCISGCLFCNFHCRPSQRQSAYTLTKEQLQEKINLVREAGGDQLLLQGGLHPNYDIEFYENMLRTIREISPGIKLNALGPPEIAHISRISGITMTETIKRLIDAGLDSLPGAGAEILSDRVRKIISPSKPDAHSWEKVMREAHKLGIGTTSTMVYGHLETLEERLDHLVLLRSIQADKPAEAPGFRAFIGWPMQLKKTRLLEKYPLSPPSMLENLKMVAISRIMLINVPHIQVSWLTIGPRTAQLALHCGADDMGSVMIEENVVSSAGSHFRMVPDEMERCIREAGFDPWQRNQDYTPVLK
ncbi:MAG: CofH family radical SAM protein [Bacteroidales bacterium]|nr:CofH family radical SAM protein [Bacteroidales bacterium]MDD2425491.1 CofH family radical SAM protein [Bacteroidales bacterium]MDD3989785.1 CofH family radical SAM protein [Bacteroidales bacterium]MDD4638552.1 CofH family radical SAM protein [Bacteroidales bacterium]